MKSTKLSERLRDLSERNKEYCRFLEDELINLRSIGRSLEELTAEQERLENGGVAPIVSGVTPRGPGNGCNFPFF